MPDAATIATNPQLATDTINLIIYSFAVAAGLSLAIERIIEIFKHYTDFESKRGEEGSRTKQVKAKAKQAYETTKQLKKAIKAYEKDGDLNAFVNAVEPNKESVIPERAIEEMALNGEQDFEHHNAIKVIPLSKPSTTQIRQRAFLQLAAAGLGIIAAEAFDLRLLVLFFNNAADMHLIDTIVTGIVIGGGSQPIHILIRFLTTRSVPLDKQDDPIKPLATPIPKQSTTTPTKPIEFDYHGGIDREKLEHRNIRPANPHKIVYHHTAMHHENSFQAVVDEITKVKKWSTGYHCVIMPDGKVEFFCRWDRVGNHAYGLNPESLGIAFHGNFHTKGNDQFSNQNGQFGNQQPTEAQLKAGAEVIALWASLYDIELDFEHSIMPHYLVKPTACPGSNFPHSALHQRILDTMEHWKQAPAQQQIAEFKQLPFVYV